MESPNSVYVALAANMGAQLARAVSRHTLCSWIHGEKRGCNIFRSVAGALNVHATAMHVHTPFNLAADALLATTTEVYCAMMRNLSSDFVAGDVLRTIVGPTPESPNRYIALTSAAFKNDKLFQKAKDFVCLEYVDVVQSGARQLAFRVLQALPSVDNNGADGDRPNAPMTGLVFATSSSQDQIDVSYLCSLSHELDASYIISHVEQCFAGIFRHLDQARAGDLRFAMPQLQVIALPETAQKACHVCERAFHWGSTTHTCCQCVMRVCKSCVCTRLVEVAGASLPTRPAAICLRCMDSARRKKSAERIASPSASNEADFAPMLTLWAEYELPTKETAYRPPPVRKLSFPFRSTSDSILASLKKRRGSMVDLLAPVALERARSYPSSEVDST
ncbi:hypothetical protein SDRG_06248 [Saprolegnia diclina VS20]|uniref:FYVE-type domain-containing protein n=1 Tax=Saprolegnia diclina (strain VS20) TaxID=1156394 RepID=T0S0G7_SAPDV|nr:hypothetical protein SDRG_06248 [Saprolegnia diclina VS20]EQC36132.1 hypothetical protein SDRG_06248 [Saprolegnia diclina VS20]|eukprot:XP_008610238.1 hypothetical protein SDRG_06248 [Saprolegnia diclina VS20]